MTEYLNTLAIKAVANCWASVSNSAPSPLPSRAVSSSSKSFAALDFKHFWCLSDFGFIAADLS